MVVAVPLIKTNMEAKLPQGRVQPPQGSVGGRPAKLGRLVSQQGRGRGSIQDKTHRRREPDSVGVFYFKAVGCWVVGFPFPLST